MLAALMPWLTAAALAGAAAPGEARPRLVVLTDIGGDPDDQQSLIRLLSCSNEFEIEGLIASASGTPGELQRDVVRADLIRDTVRAYGQVRDNLARHAAGYPTAAELLAKVQEGNPQRGVTNLGEGHDTAGSDWLIRVVDRADPRPVGVTIWGGSTDLAQALWRVRQERSRTELEAFLAKLRVYAIGHQDDTGPWITTQFPELFYLLSLAPGGRDKRDSAYRGMYLGGDELLTSPAWVEAHVRTGHGPLGELYPNKTWRAPNPHATLKEGDTPAWFYFLPTGLSDPEQPTWGGWGGRFTPTGGRHFGDAIDTVTEPATSRGDASSARATVWRWRAAFQAEFAARMDWCVKPPAAANHPPVAVLDGEAGRTVMHRAAAPGETVQLDAAGSRDPDAGQMLGYRWWVYPEAGSYAGSVSVTQGGSVAEVRLPADAAGTTVHLILEVTDSGQPPLTRYRRVVLQVAAR
jgi:hypothetical protein